MNGTIESVAKLDATSIPAEAYLAWVRTKMEEQDRLMDELLSPLLSMDVDVRTSEQWLEDLGEVARAFVEPERQNNNVIAMRA